MLVKFFVRQRSCSCDLFMGLRFPRGFGIFIRHESDTCAARGVKVSEADALRATDCGTGGGVPLSALVADLERRGADCGGCLIAELELERTARGLARHVGEHRE